MYTTTIACQRDVESKKHLLDLSENRLSKINLAITINPTKIDKAVFFCGMHHFQTDLNII